MSYTYEHSMYDLVNDADVSDDPDTKIYYSNAGSSEKCSCDGERNAKKCCGNCKIKRCCEV
jgi:hypothetical protein